jgi:8-oxo-dGTP diphosphatase
LAGKVIHAAGGIVVRNGARRLVAVVQRSKDDRWVLPRGKLKATERPVVGAQREVVEETGHRVRVREFLGAITYRARGRPKVVQFWHMQAAARPSHGLMGDIAAVEWLPLKAAIRRLSYPLEKLFLRSVGRRAIPRRKKAARRKKRKAKSLAKSLAKTLAKRKARAKTPRPAKRRHARRKTASKTTSKTANKATAKTRATRLRTRKALSASVPTAARAERRGMLQRMLGTLGR